MSQTSRTAAIPTEQSLLTATQVADRCQVAVRTVRRWISAGDLPVLRLGRAVRIAEADLERFLRQARH